MSILDNLLKAAAASQNLWKSGRQTLGNWVEATGMLAPFIPETGLSELIAGGPTNYTARATSNPSPVSNDSSYESKSANMTLAPGGQSIGSFEDALKAGAYRGWDRAAAEADFKATGGPGGTDTSAEDTYAKLRASAEARYNARKKEAEGQYEIAKGLFDEIIDNLAKKREEFAQMYDEGQQDILGRTQQERGNLQSSAKMTDRKAANTMRALGIGGSGVLNYFGDLEQQRNKSEGELYSQREKNERELGRQNADRIAWANAAEGEAGRNLEAARQKMEAAKDYGWADYIGHDALIDQNMLDYVQSIQDTANAMALAKASASNYQVDPYATNISSFLGALNTPTMESAPRGAAGVQNVSLQEQDPLIRRYLAQPGGGMYA